jgi:hypothetical protein
LGRPPLLVEAPLDLGTHGGWRHVGAAQGLAVWVEDQPMFLAFDIDRPTAVAEPALVGNEREPVLVLPSCRLQIGQGFFQLEELNG